MSKPDVVYLNESRTCKAGFQDAVKTDFNRVPYISLDALEAYAREQIEKKCTLKLPMLAMLNHFKQAAGEEES